VEIALFLLVAVVVVALVVFTSAAGNRAARWREPMPSAARWAAGIAGVVWIVAAFGFGFGALVGFTGAVLIDPDLWIVGVVSVIAAPVTFLLGLLLFAPSRRVLVWSTLWAALWAALIAIVVVGSEVDWGASAGVIIAPIIAGLLSLLAWKRIAQQE
jgi:hypothetical protein